MMKGLKSPVSDDTKAILKAALLKLPKEFRTANQFLGRQYAGCGATIGVMPRCDFGCRGCYLNRDANRMSAESVAGIKQQLHQIRGWLGNGGNVQITDGEVTLRPIDELIEIIRYACEIGLVPMLMTHGDTFRKSPTILKRLMVEGGLTELSIHIDTTQRGRMGREYKKAVSEQALMPLRDEFAQMIRSLRRETGNPLEVAMTFTVTPDNLAGVPGVIRWVCKNADAFKMISFQPVAQVGRTDAKLGKSATVDALWIQVAEGLYGNRKRVNELLQHKGIFGHPSCTHFIQGAVVSQKDQQPNFHPLFRNDNANDKNFIQGFFDRFGGVSFRLESRWGKFLQSINMVKREPKFIVSSLIPFLIRRIRELGAGNTVNFIFTNLSGRTKVHYLNIVSHHFMSRAEIETPLGQERLNACVFKVPINDSMISMCKVNALGYREGYYESIQAAKTLENDEFEPLAEENYSRVTDFWRSTNTETRTNKCQQDAVTCDI